MNEWKPMGFNRTLRFFLHDPHRQRVASWRHFGWELEIEMRGNKPTSISLWLIEEEKS